MDRFVQSELDRSLIMPPVTLKIPMPSGAAVPARPASPAPPQQPK
jgi:hypothetical protein